VAVAVLGVAAAGAFHYLPIRHLQPSRIAQLAPTGAPPGFKGKPSRTSSPPAASSPLAELKKAATLSPHSTGSYLVQWGGSPASADFVSVVVYLLPSAADAAIAASQAAQSYLSAQSYKANSYALVGPFSVPSVTGATGALYSPTSKRIKQDLAVYVERVDKVVVVSLMDQTGTPSTVQGNAVTAAQAEYLHLHSVAPNFSLIRTHWPTLATLVYSAVALLLASCAFIVPVLFRGVRRQRGLAREEAARRQVMGRGGKIAKRQAAHRR
jgi:hypothetical protein